MRTASLQERLRHIPQQGTLLWIGVRPAHAAPIVVLPEAELIEGRGIRGDRASKSTSRGKRQVTIIQHEHLAVIAALTGRAQVGPELLRRNLVIAGVNLLSLRNQRFAIGKEVILEGSGPCEPCSKMDDALGDGAFQAMRGHGGITTRVVRGGTIRLHDLVRHLPPQELEP